MKYVYIVWYNDNTPYEQWQTIHAIYDSKKDAKKEMKFMNKEFKDEEFINFNVEKKEVRNNKRDFSE